MKVLAAHKALGVIFLCLLMLGVGLTYASRRIDWPLSHSQWAPSASWCTFSVESSRDQPLIVHSRREVSPSPADQESG